MVVSFTYQIVHNNAFYNIELPMRSRIINAQPTRKFQVICLRFKIIRYYRLNIARDVIHEAIY